MQMLASITLVAFVLVFGAAAQYPGVVENGGHPIKWLWDEAIAGNFRYDASRDWPQIEATWPEFLHRRGQELITDF